jgi:ribA/ribD-fused uncharacterized protein
MGLPATISNFHTFEGDNEWAALSNFWQGQPIQFQNFTFLTAEHMFQAFKARNPADFKRAIACPTAAEVRQFGKHMLRLRPDWERVKYDAMRLALACKFRLGREEAGVLLATGDALLVEGTTWGDEVWGVDLKEGRKRATTENRDGEPWAPGEGWQLAPGRNWLGALLMARRAELHAEQQGARFSYQSIMQFVRYEPVRRDR